MAQPPPFRRLPNFAGINIPSRAPDGIPEPRPSSPRRGSLEDVLLHAAYDGNLRLVKKTARALDGGQGRIAEKVRAVRYSDGMGVLYIAAGGGRLPVCRYLVEELRMDVNATEYLKGETPLTLAINVESVDVVRYLLDHGLCEIVEVLLSKGAYIDALTTGALHCAAYNGRDAVVKLLLDHHADHSNRAWGVFTPLVTAIYGRSLKCVKLLLEAGADVQGVEKETPLMVAAADGLTDILECLVQAGADPNALDCLGQTPLEIAARFSSRKDVEILFPVTSRIVGVSDWSVDGIIDYMKSVPPAKVDDVHNAMLAGGKFQGREAVRNKDYLAATKIYTEVMDLDPDDATLFSNRSLCWFHLGDGKKALVDAQACRVMQPGWAKAYYREGAALMLLKDYEKACGAFLEALKLEPGNTETENALREALESLKLSCAVKD